MNFAKRFRKASVILLILSFVLAWAIPTSASEEGQDDNNEYIGIVIDQTNTERVKNGSSGLAMNNELMKAAQLKAEDMAMKSYFSHTSPEGINPWHWFYEADYKPRLAGENLGLTYSKTSKLVNAWMNSETHKRNLLNNDFEDIGIGVAKGLYKGREVYFTVQLFGVEL
jgi:uncharacterized protein YkwD